jgi:2-polyprenyl-3-methyl-5-hydroxy-6-metoxy-1,4-benzoquinol methylase
MEAWDVLTQTIRRMIRRVVPTPAAQPEVRRTIDPSLLEGLEARDAWFHSHFVWAPGVIIDHLKRLVPLESSVVLDFGCGEGLMAKGVAQVAREVHGVDIVPNFWRVEERFDEMFGVENRIPPAKLIQVDPEKPLPYKDGSFDAVIAWSVFEHVADTPRALREIHRVMRPGGAFFLTINPLYYSAHGCHLWNVVDEPWVHLKISHEELCDRIRAAVMRPVEDEGRTDIYQGNTPEAYRDSLFVCLDSLNKLTLNQLVSHVQNAGFTIVHQETRQTLPFEPTPELLEQYPREDLMTDEVTLLLQS